MRLIWLLLVIVTLSGCSVLPAYDPRTGVMKGDEAKKHILEFLRGRARKNEASIIEVPSSASNFYIFHYGWAGRFHEFWVFDCPSREECIKAVESLAGIRENQLSAWSPPNDNAIMQGPSYYHQELNDAPWGVPQIANGLEYVPWHEKKITEYWAIDLDRNRIYCYQTETQ